jgi:hypothetical protein
VNGCFGFDSKRWPHTFAKGRKAAVWRRPPAAMLPFVRPFPGHHPLLCLDTEPCSQAWYGPVKVAPLGDFLSACKLVMPWFCVMNGFHRLLG